MDEVFVGHMGNCLTIERLLATGTVDVFAMEEVCSPLAIDMYAEKYQVTLVAVSTIIDLPGVKYKIPFEPSEVDKIADKLIELGNNLDPLVNVVATGKIKEL